MRTYGDVRAPIPDWNDGGYTQRLAALVSTYCLYPIRVVEGLVCHTQREEQATLLFALIEGRQQVETKAAGLCIYLLFFQSEIGTLMSLRTVISASLNVSFCIELRILTNFGRFKGGLRSNGHLVKTLESCW